jgi:MSHA biogenesis protein MshN
VAAQSNTGAVVIQKQARIATANDRAENEYRKALVVLNQGRVNEAISGLQAALREDGTHGNARQALAAILVEQKRLEEAQILLQEGLAQNPAQPNIVMRLARIQVERGDIKAAGETLQRNASSATGSADYRAFHAGVLQRLGEHMEAINEYQAALRLAPQSSVWWMGLGISFEAQGRTMEARDAFQRAHAGGNLSAELDRFVEQKIRQLQ